MAIQIQEENRTMHFIRAGVEFCAKRVVAFGIIRFWRENLTRLSNVVFRLGFYDVVEIDKIAVDISKDITRKVGIKKYRPGTDERLYQAFALGQVSVNIFEQGYLPPAHFKKARFFFMLPN